MKLVSLELKNFRQYLDSRIAFSDGVTGIIGPNGSGKTTILEAVAWALYGSPAVRGTNDTIRARASEGGAKVSVRLVFELSGSLYTVTRTLDASGRNSTAVLEVDGRPLRSGVNEVSDAVQRLLRMDYRAFFTSFFTAQKELDFMSQMDPRARAAMISRMLGYDRLLQARDKANTEKLALQKEIEGLKQGLVEEDELKKRLEEGKRAVEQAKAGLETAQADSESARADLEKLKPVKELSDQKATRHGELIHTLELVSADLARSEERLEKLEAERLELERKQAELDSLADKLKEYEEARDEYRKLAELQKHEGARQKLLGQISALENELEGLNRRLEGLSAARRRVERAGIALREGEDQLRKADERIRSERERLVAFEQGLIAQAEQLRLLKSDVEEKKARIEQAGEDGACPTCERPLKGELPKVLKGFEAHADEIASQLLQIESRKKELEAEAASLKALECERAQLSQAVDSLRLEKAAADAALGEIEKLSPGIAERTAMLRQAQEQLAAIPRGFDQERFRLLREKGEELRESREKAVGLKAALERRPAVDSEITEIKQSIESKREAAEQAKQSLRELAFSPEDHEKLTKEFEAVRNRAGEAALAVERRKGELAAAQAVLDAAKRDEAQNKSRRATVEAKQSERLHVDALAKAFDALRNQLNERIRPELESAAGELLSTITDGRYNVLEINGDYVPVIRDDGEPKPVISGGEEDVLNLALRLAISQMIADRANQSFSLLILDEVFGSLDESRRDNVVALLQNLKNRFEQIMLITHIEAIHEAVDNCLWVRFDERTKTSRLTEQFDDPELLAAGA